MYTLLALLFVLFFFFFFNDTATTEIYTLSLHDALPHLGAVRLRADDHQLPRRHRRRRRSGLFRDRKSTRLNSSHVAISYAVFCLKKKTKHTTQIVIVKKKNIIQKHP